MSQNQSVQDVPVIQLKFDPENPRLPSTSVDGNDEQAVIRWMLEDASIIELMLSIGERGYFSGEALLVVPNKDSTGQYTVIEGNRRLTAVKLLLNPELAPIRQRSVQQVSDDSYFKPDRLPVIVFNERDDILYYLGYRHITGIKTWGALAKAKYLNQLIKSMGEGNPQVQYKALAKIIGSRASTVAKTLAGYAVYEVIHENRYFNIKDLDEESIDFAVLTTALNYPNFPKHLGMESNQDRSLQSLNLNHLREVTSWLYEKVNEGKTRLGESRKLGDLNSVLGEPRALERFRNGEPLAIAVLYTEKPAEAFHKAILEAKSRLELARDYIHLIDHPTTAHSEFLLEIQKLARLLKNVVDEALVNSEL